MLIRRNASRVSILLVSTALVASAACKKKQDDGAPAPSASPTAPATPPPATGSAAVAIAGSDTPTTPPPVTPPVATGPKGLAAPDNNPALVTAAASMKDCKLDPSYPTNSCGDQIKPFMTAFDKAKDAATAFNLIEDPSPQVRYLGLRALADNMIMQDAGARKQGLRLLAAATAETDPTNAGVFGTPILQGDFNDAAYADAVKVLFETHALPEMRASVASNLAAQGEPKWLPILMTRYAAETDVKVKVAIIDSMYTAGDAAKICPFLLDIMKDPSNELAAAAGYGLVWSNGKCKDSYDAFVTAYAAHVKTTKPDYSFVLKTNYMAQAKEATDAQKAAFFVAAKAVVADTSLEGMARASVLETLGTYDPAAKKYAKEFAGDKDRWVSDKAKTIK